MTKKTYLTYILILGALTALGPFSIDMYLPGFGDIAVDLLDIRKGVHVAPQRNALLELSKIRLIQPVPKLRLARQHDL